MQQITKLLKTQNSTLNAEVNTLETKLPDENTIIHTNKYNRDKQNLEKIGDIDVKYQIRVVQ